MNQKIYTFHNQAIVFTWFKNLKGVAICYKNDIEVNIEDLPILERLWFKIKIESFTEQNPNVRIWKG